MRNAPARLLLLPALVLALLAARAAALPSLDTKDIMELSANTKIAGKSVEVRYTVMRDADTFTDFYYLPSQPFLAVKDGAPVFSIVKYQDASRENREKLVEGGILQFAATLAMPDDAKALIAKEIEKRIRARADGVAKEADATEAAWAKRKKTEPEFEPNRLDKSLVEAKRAWVRSAEQVSAAAIDLKMMPLSGASVNLYAPAGTGDGAGKLLDTKAGPAIAPANAGALMPFSLALGPLGVNVYQALVEGATGIPMVVEYKYSGMTAPAGFQVVVDWDQTFKHYSRSEATRVGGSFGPIKAGVAVDRDKVREELMNNKCIEVRVLTNPETFSMKDVTRLLEPLLARIQSELCEQMTPPQVEPARADAGQGTGRSGGNDMAPSLGPLLPSFGAQTGFAMKDIKKVKKGREVFNFEVRQMVERTTMAGGFIGIGEYPEATRKACVTVVPRGGWESAYLVLPVVADRVAATGVVAIDLTAVVVDPEGREGARQTARWEAKTKAWSFEGKTRGILPFGLMDLYNKFGEQAMKEKAKYRLETQFTFERDSFASRQEIPMFTGDFPAASPLNTIRAVTVAFDGLTFREALPDSSLQSVKVTLRSGKRIFSSKSLRATQAGDPPDEVVWYVDANLPVTVEAQFDYSDILTGKMRRTHLWKYNGLPLDAPLANERSTPPTKAKIDERFAEIEQRKMSGAEKIRAWAGIVRDVAGTQTIAELPEAKVGKADSLPPLGTSITLSDARLRDTWRAGVAGHPPSEDDGNALTEYLETLDAKGKTLRPERIQRIAGRPLWFAWDEAIDE